VDGDVVADGHPVADDDGVAVALAVEDAAVLHIGAGADADGIHVAAQDGVHPDRRTLAEDHVAKDLRRDVDVATGSDLGRVPPIGSDHEGLLGDLS
jgi:hypothetical protein